MIRTIEETDHGVLLYPPKEHPYYRLVWHTPDGQRKTTTAGRDRDQAWAKAWVIDAELAKSTADPFDRDISQFAEAWLEAMAKHWGPLHTQKNRQMAEGYIIPQLGTAPAWTLTREQVKQCAEGPASAGTRKHLRSALGSMLTWGFSEDWTSQPREHFFPRQPRTHQSGKGRQHGENHQFISPRMRPSPAACKALAEALHAQQMPTSEGPGNPELAEELWLMAATAASCGLRQGEQWASLVGDLDFASGQWHIERQVIRPKGGPMLTLPKWGRIRDTIIPELTIWGEPLRDRLAAHVDGRQPDELLFPALRGGYFHPSNFARDHLNAARAVAAPIWQRDWTWHSLRHAFCTDLLQRGARDTDVALVAGHRNSATTRNMYVGATAGTTGRLNDLMAAAR
ncbi:MAG TPA: site-specific integrase [Frankiaceae bacterium]|jgi:hypothetical protein